MLEVLFKEERVNFQGKKEKAFSLTMRMMTKTDTKISRRPLKEIKVLKSSNSMNMKILMAKPRRNISKNSMET